MTTSSYKTRGHGDLVIVDRCFDDTITVYLCLMILGIENYTEL